MAFLQAVEVGANLGVGPVCGADEFAADDAVAIDDVCLRPHVGVEELGGGLIGIANCDEVYMAAEDEVRVGVCILVDADGEHHEVGVVVVQLEQGRQLLDAGGALAPPEVQQDDFAAIGSEVDRRGSIGDGEVGGALTCLRRMGAAVAGGGERQG